MGQFPVVKKIAETRPGLVVDLTLGLCPVNFRIRIVGLLSESCWIALTRYVRPSTTESETLCFQFTAESAEERRGIKQNGLFLCDSLFIPPAFGGTSSASLRLSLVQNDPLPLSANNAQLNSSDCFPRLPSQRLVGGCGRIVEEGLPFSGGGQQGLQGKFDTSVMRKKKSIMKRWEGVRIGQGPTAEGGRQLIPLPLLFRQRRTGLMEGGWGLGQACGMMDGVGWMMRIGS